MRVRSLLLLLPLLSFGAGPTAAQHRSGSHQSTTHHSSAPHQSGSHHSSHAHASGSTTTHRSKAATDAFKRQTGYPHGRPGYVIDHKIPLACGGADDPGNMQWQTKADAKAKDKVERKGCTKRR